MKRVIVSAPLYLSFGTSGIKSGQPALYAAVSLRTYVSLSEGTQERVSQNVDTPVRSILDFFYKQEKISVKPKINISVNAPRLLLNSDIAVMIALFGALQYYLKKLWNPIHINQLVYDWGKKKSIDWGARVSVTTFGGFVWFRRELSYLNSIWQLPIKLKPAINTFYLSNKLKITSRSHAENGEVDDVLQSFAEALKKNAKKEISKNLQQLVTLKAIDTVTLNTSKSANTHSTVIPVGLGEEGIRLESK